METPFAQQGLLPEMVKCVFRLAEHRGSGLERLQAPNNLPTRY